MVDSDIKFYMEKLKMTEAEVREYLNIKPYCSCGVCGTVLELMWAQWSPLLDIQLAEPISRGWIINRKEREKSLCPHCTDRREPERVRI